MSRIPNFDPCSDLGKTIAQLALHVAKEPHVKSVNDVVREIQKDIPEITRREVVESLNEAHKGGKRTKSDIAAKIADIKREAKNDAALRKNIGVLERHLRESTLPPGATPRPDRSPETVKTLRMIVDDLRRQVRGSDPAVRKRLSEQIEKLAERLEQGVKVPEPRAKPVLSREAERLAYERDRLQREIRQAVQDLRPKSFFTKASNVATAPTNAARTIMTSFDYSAALRQGGFIATGHPVRAAKSLGPMFKAGWSAQAMHTMMSDIRSRPNAHLYERYKLFLAEHAGPLTKHEEVFMSNLAERIPIVGRGVKGSERAYVAFLNKLRADSFDAMVETLGRRGEVTAAEGRGIANFINVATGRGGWENMGKTGTFLSQTLFSPRYAMSRFQLLYGDPLFRAGSWRARKLIATEYARALAGYGLILALAALAGAGVELDPHSSDFGKIRFGNTRLDPLAGLSQTAVLATRLGTWKTKPVGGSSAGKTRDMSGYDAWVASGRFLRYKLSPLASLAADVYTGEDAMGKPTTVAGEAKKLVTPLGFGDIYAAMKENGVPAGTAMAIASIFGWGLQVYDDKASEKSSPRQ